MRHKQPPPVTVLELPDDRQRHHWGQTLVAGLVAAAIVIVAVALWQMSAGLSIGVAAIGVGIGVERALYGAGVFILNARRGQADLLRAGRQNQRYLEAEWD